MYMLYLQLAWTEVVGCGPSWPHRSGSSPPYCGWHSSRSSEASRRAWAERKLQRWQKKDTHDDRVPEYKRTVWRLKLWLKAKKANSTHNQRHWPPRCLSRLLPPLCSWWQTFWLPYPWGHNGHSLCSGWAAHGHGPSWHDRCSSSSWSVKQNPLLQLLYLQVVLNLKTTLPTDVPKLSHNQS